MVRPLRRKVRRKGAIPLAELCRLYWYPLYIFARRRGIFAGRRPGPDPSQGFFLHLLEHRGRRLDFAPYGQRENSSGGGRPERACGLWGINAPYIWVRGPRSATSWEVFDRILNEANIVITPGSGFGAAGGGYFTSPPSIAAPTRKRLREGWPP